MRHCRLWPLNLVRERTIAAGDLQYAPTIPALQHHGIDVEQHGQRRRAPPQRDPLPVGIVEVEDADQGDVISSQKYRM